VTTLEAAVLSAGRLGPPRTRPFGGAVEDVAVEGLSCASTAACEIVGDETPKTGGFLGYYVGLGHGAAIGGVHVVHPGANNTSTQDGIACPHLSTTCYLIGNNEAGGLLWSVDIGGSALTKVAAPAATPEHLSCLTLKYCTAVGAGTGAVPVVLSFTDGKPGPEQEFAHLGQMGFSAVARVSSTKYVALATQAGSVKTDVILGTAA
jgi:hypothetical protein